MRKILMLSLMLLLLVPSIAFAETESYEVIVDGQVQRYKAKVLEEGVYIPLDGFVLTVGEENIPENHEALLTLKNINGFDYISSTDIQMNYQVLVVLDDKDEELKLYTVQGMVENLQTMETDLKKRAPDLYQALEKTVVERYSYESSLNGMLEIDYANAQMEQAMGVSNAFFSTEVFGYMDTAKEDFEMMMNMKVDAQPLMSQSIQNVGIKKIGNAFYIRDPQLQVWTKELIDENMLREQTAMMAGDNSVMWIIAKNMKRTESAGVVTYKVTYTEEDIEALIETLVGEGAYDDLMDAISEQGISFSIDQLDATYVIENGYLTKQSMMFNCSLGAIQGKATMIMSADSTYYDYGVKKNIAVPVVQETSSIQLQ